MGPVSPMCSKLQPWEENKEVKGPPQDSFQGQEKVRILQVMKVPLGWSIWTHIRHTASDFRNSSNSSWIGCKFSQVTNVAQQSGLSYFDLVCLTQSNLVLPLILVNSCWTTSGWPKHRFSQSVCTTWWIVAPPSLAVCFKFKHNGD